MLKALRLPLLALLSSIILLVIALVASQSAETDDTPTTHAPPVGVQTDTTPDTTTLVPTVRVVENVLAPVPAQLTEALIGNIGKLNPLFANLNPVDSDITSLIFEGLTTINAYGEVVPDLAERWEVSRDGLDYVFLLRREVLWQDGLPFTAADVKYTIDVMRDPDFPGDPALTMFWRTVEMTTIDDYTIRFRLVQPLASFPEQLRIGMLPAHVLEGYPVGELDRHPFNLAPIGTGAYQREEIYADRGQLAISLRVAPTYRQRAEGQSGYAIDRIVFRTYATVDEAIAAFARGEVNSIGQLPPERLASLNSLNNLGVYSRIMPSVGVLVYNWQEESLAYFQNQRVRIAFARGIDRLSAVSRTMGGLAIPAQSPLIPGSWAYDSSAVFPEFNLDSARSMLETVDFESTPEPTPTQEEPPSEETASIRRHFSILVLNSPHLAALAEDLAQQWNALGFTVTVETVDDGMYQQRLVNGEFDTAIVEYSFAPYADPDPYTFWHVSQYKTGANYGGMRDLPISNVLERARREALGINRVQLYEEFQRLFVERAPALTLYHPLYIYIVDSRMEGIQLGFISTPADRFTNIQYWQWQ